MKKQKLLQRVLAGSTKNISFGEMVALVEAFGFRLSRVSGSHHISAHAEVPELVNKKSAGWRNLTRFDNS
jgi:hypothetical protein